MAALADLVGWVTIQEAIRDWPDAPGEEAEGYADLADLLATAHEYLSPRAVPVAEGAPIPRRYARAQLLYARHLYARERSGNRDQVGVDGLAVSTYPLVLEALALLRAGRSPFRGLR